MARLKKSARKLRGKPPLWVRVYVNVGVSTPAHTLQRTQHGHRHEHGSDLENASMAAVATMVFFMRASVGFTL
jgi:hypothetical protein